MLHFAYKVVRELGTAIAHMWSRDDTAEVAQSAERNAP